MGIISKGIPGGFSGKPGAVTGGNRKGIACMRSPSASQRTRFSHGQLQQQAKFKTVRGFLHTMSLLLKTGFREYAIRIAACNKAFSYPGFRIGYAMARVRQGDLPNASKPAAAAGDAIIREDYFYDGVLNHSLSYTGMARKGKIFYFLCATLKKPE